MKYIRPDSLTFWSGAASIAIGIALLVIPESRSASEIAQVISALAGGADASPAQLILVGLGLIGVRDAIERKMGNG